MNYAAFIVPGLIFFEYLLNYKNTRVPMPLRSVTTNMVSSYVRKYVALSLTFLSVPAVFGLLARFHIRPFEIPLYDSPFYFAGLVLVAFVINDFFAYWMHRLNHKVDFLWAIHEYHHSSLYFNMSVAARLPLLFIFEAFVNTVFLAALGFPNEVVQVVVPFALAHVLFTHSSLTRELPWLETFTITPHAHSKHHENEYSRQNSNFGQSLNIFDRMWGTYNPRPRTFQYGVQADYESESVVRAQAIPMYRYFKRKWAKISKKD